MSNGFFVISGIETGQLNALVKNIMKQTGASDPNEAVRLVNSGECTIIRQPVPRWREQDGVIYFTLPPTDNTTGPQWIERLKRKGFRFSNWVESVLNSSDFQPTTGIISDIAVLKGTLWNDSDRITSNIQAEAERRNFTKPNAEVACLIREMFTDKELEAMGFWWIITMHEPINDSDGDPLLLYAGRGDGGHWLDAAYDDPDDWWGGDRGFAFVSQFSGL